jgi:uncharacterized protein YpmS
MILIILAFVSGLMIGICEKEEGRNFWKSFILSFLAFLTILIMFETLIIYKK